MSLGLIKPGASAALRHPKTGALIEPIGYLKNGRAVWPVLGAGPDDPDDPEFTGDGGGSDDDSDDEDDDNEDDEPKSKKSKSRKRSSDEDDDEDDEEDDDDKPTRPERQAARYRVRLREEREKNTKLEARLKALEDKDKKPEERTTEELAEAKKRAERAERELLQVKLERAFTRATDIDWVDPEDAMAVADRLGLLEDIIDEDGTVDKRELRRSLRELAKRKPHLVKAKSRAQDEDEDDDEDEDERPRRSAPRTPATRRKGSRGTANRDELVKNFPVLRGLGVK